MLSALFVLIKRCKGKVSAANEKRLKDVGLQVPNGQSVGLQVLNGREAQHEKGTSDESDDEMAAPEPKPTGATKAPEAPKLRLAVEEGLELQNTPLVTSILQMFSPKPEGVQHTSEGVQHV